MIYLPFTYKIAKLFAGPFVFFLLMRGTMQFEDAAAFFDGLHTPSVLSCLANWYANNNKVSGSNSTSSKNNPKCALRSNWNGCCYLVGQQFTFSCFLTFVWFGHVDASLHGHVNVNNALYSVVMKTNKQNKPNNDERVKLKIIKSFKCN